MTSESVPVLSTEEDALADAARFEVSGRTLHEYAQALARIEALEGALRGIFLADENSRAWDWDTNVGEAIAAARTALTSEAHRG